MPLPIPDEARRPGPTTSALTILVIGLALFLLPLPTDGTVLRAVATLLAASREQTVVAGNSVVDHVSRCDADARTIPQLLAASIGKPVTDVSYGGQPLAVTINLAALALKRTSQRPVFLLVAPFQFNAAVGLDARAQGFFRLTAGRLAVNDLAAGPLADRRIAAPPTAELTPFRYRGVDYPDYAGVQSRYMAPERDRMPCPERLGRDLRFITAYYWNSYLRSPIDGRYVDDLARLRALAVARRRPLHVVVLPIDHDDIARLDPAMAAAIASKRDALIVMMRRAGIAPLDLTGVAAATDFADRWCACGHLGQSGRTRVAAALTAIRRPA